MGDLYRKTASLRQCLAASLHRDRPLLSLEKVATSLPVPEDISTMESEGGNDDESCTEIFENHGTSPDVIDRDSAFYTGCHGEAFLLCNRADHAVPFRMWGIHCREASLESDRTPWSDGSCVFSCSVRSKLRDRYAGKLESASDGVPSFLIKRKNR